MKEKPMSTCKICGSFSGVESKSEVCADCRTAIALERIAEALVPISDAFKNYYGKAEIKLPPLDADLVKPEPDPPLKVGDETIPFLVGETVEIHNPEGKDYHSKDDCFYWERYKRYEGRTDSIDSFEFPNIPHLKLADICVPVDWLMHVSGLRQWHFEEQQRASSPTDPPLKVGE
jgi:hypothetical protein